MRSINYQLSNLKYIQEGWTVRSDNIVDLDEMNLDEVEFNLVSYTPIFSATQKVIEFFT